MIFFDTAEEWDAAALERVLSGEPTGENSSYVPDPALKALEGRAIEAMENVYQLLEAAERRDAVTKNSEVALRALKARCLTPDVDDSGSSSSSGSGSGSGLNSDSEPKSSSSSSDRDLTEELESDSENGSGQDNLSEDTSESEADSDADYTDNKSPSESYTLPNRLYAPSGLRISTKSVDQEPKAPTAQSPPTSKQGNSSKQAKLTSNRKAEKKKRRKAERQKVKQAENDFLDFLDRMIDELDNLRTLGISSTELFLKQHYAKKRTEKAGDEAQQAILTSRFRDSVERMIIELFRIGLPHAGGQISTEDAEVIANCALMVGLQQGVEIPYDEFQEAIVGITEAITSRPKKVNEAQFSGLGIRAAPALRLKSDTEPKLPSDKTNSDGKLGPTGRKKGFFGWAAKFFQPSGKTAGFIPPAEESRDYTIKDKWTEKDLETATGGRHPFIDPEITLILQGVHGDAHETYENNERYIWGCEYLEADLEDITIETLPSNGKQKPGHKSPEDASYYCKFTTRLFSSINTWIEKYIIPTRKTASIKIDSFTVLPVIQQTLRKFDYFEESDFITPAGEKSLKKRNLRRRIKRQMFFQYLFYQVLYENIWSKWLYGLDDYLEAHVLNIAGLDETQKQTKQGHFARGRWFTDNIRRKPTGMTQTVLDHQAHIATTLRQLFVPLLNSNNAGPGPTNRRMCTSAEKELLLIISDAQALQLMFQSEVTFHQIIFDWPGARFDKQWMVNAANSTDMERLGGQPVPGKTSGLTSEDKIDFVFQPGLYIEEAAEIYEYIVVA
ncbi:hypothetical protein TWF506_007906 [Arthrobotrys conoides]|uniref:Uncharacterized protein n=1 Tax=Arthrobotrys conoides TaxID=74498 RepID=A0AAN8RUT2_9PEZI